MNISQDLMSNEYAAIAWSFYVNPNHCSNAKHYEDFIRINCHTDYKQGMGVTHILVAEDGQHKEIAGYITLRSSSLIMDSGEGYKLGLPALEIAELAVHKNYERQGLGTDMVKFAINEAAELNKNKVGFQYVVLCADNEAVAFYSNAKLNFQPLRQLHEVPREHRNSKCIPMMLKIAT